MTENNTRSHTITWQDPTAAAAAGLAMSGLEYIQAILSGQLTQAPIAATINMRLAEVEEGRAVFTCDPAEHLYNPIGSIHGGVAATLLDSAMGCAVHTTLPAGTMYGTVELHINYVRPITLQTGRISCEGRVIHRGRQIATAEGRVLDAEGRLYAHGTTTCMLFPVGSRG